MEGGRVAVLRHAHLVKEVGDFLCARSGFEVCQLLTASI